MKTQLLLIKTRNTTLTKNLLIPVLDSKGNILDKKLKNMAATNYEYLELGCQFVAIEQETNNQIIINCKSQMFVPEHFSTRLYSKFETALNKVLHKQASKFMNLYKQKDRQQAHLVFILKINLSSLPRKIGGKIKTNNKKFMQDCVKLN